MSSPAPTARPSPARRPGGPRRAVDLRYRYLYKPVVFCACLVPLVGCIGGILALYGLHWAPGFNLGVDPERYVLDVFGKTTLNMLLITLAVSPVRQLTGWGNLLRLRRMLGLFAFCYALLHFSTYVGVYENLSWSTIWQDILKRPYITIGVAALLMLVPLAITSTNKMMRRLGRRWQQLHRLIYLIVCLGVVHYWKMIKLAGREVLIYAGIVAVLLAWRVWRQWRQSRQRQAVPAVGARDPAATSRSSAPKAPGTA